jgi:hypothetical protein
MSNPTPILKIDVNKLELRKPKKENTKNATGKAFHVYHGPDKLKVVLPEMTAPFGAGNSEKFPEKFALSLSFEGCKKTLEKMKAIDEKIQELILEKKAEIFPKDLKSKKPVPLDVLKSRYKPFIQAGDESKNYADRINLSVQRKTAPEGTPEEEKAQIEKEFRTMDAHLLVHPDGTPIHVNTDNIRECIPFGSRIKAVAEFAYLWVLGSSQECYPVWTFVLGKLVSTAAKSTYDILNDEDDEVPASVTQPMDIDSHNVSDAHDVSGTDVLIDEEDAHLAAAAL